MNYLAHIYLSGQHDQVKIGNFIADFIYGNKFQKYDIGIQKGIMMHRYIDTYTDAHPIFRRSKKRLFSDFRHYSAVIVDMFYDHFLAKNFSDYSEISLDVFVSDFYDLMSKEQEFLPKEVKRVLPIMIKYNWLESYKDLDRLQDILGQMDNRTKHATNLQSSVEFLIKDYEAFESDFKLFFSDLLRAREDMFKSLEIH